MKRRTAQITVRLTNSEKQHLEKQAGLSGMGMEPFIRNLIAGVNLKERPPEFWKDVVNQLSAIGNNINQIARVANSTGSVSNESLEETKRLMKEVWSIIKEV